MATIGGRIRLARKKRDMTLEEVAKIVNVSRQTIQRYETGVIENIPSDKIELLSAALNTTPSYIMGWDDEPQTSIPAYPNIYPVKKKKLPILGSIACGKPIMAEEYFEGYVYADAKFHADFCLRAQGDSMINARIYDGDIVFIRQQPVVDNGEIAAVAIDDEVTLKRVYVGDNFIELRAENPRFRPMIYRKEDFDSFRIIGKAVAFQGDVV